MVTLNTSVVGCFRTCSQIFRKGGRRVEASNSHSDFFVKNPADSRAASGFLSGQAHSFSTSRVVKSVSVFAL